MSLPPELKLSNGVPADDGTIVYADRRGGSAAVQVLTDGTTRIETVVPSSSAPHRFTYGFGDGIKPVILADGEVALTVARGGVTATVGRVARPWAFDAKGRPVSTEYHIVNGSLVQEINTDSGTAYPVVADPSVTYGWAVYYHYNQSETKQVASMSSYFGIVSAVCSFISGGLGTAFCISAIGGMATSIGNTFVNAAASGRCVQFTEPYVPSAVTFALQLRWQAVSC